MKKSLTVKDVMTKSVISVYPETTVLQANEILNKHNLNGVPVIDEDNKVVGALTVHDLLVRGSGIHLPASWN